jgi:glycosyltransferase involved in cell wall biosynthesis
MRVFVVHRYYWPDKSPCAGIMRWIAKHLANDGHDVDVLTSQPSYREFSRQNRQPRVEQHDAVSVTRLLLPTEMDRPLWRILNALHLGLRIVLRSLFKRYDVIIVATVPPVLGGFFSALAAKLTRARFIYYCMDLHPEIGRISGDFANPLLFRVLQVLDDWACRQASPVLVHSEDMRKTLRQRPRGSEYRIEVMNNFALPSEQVLSCELDAQWNKKDIRLRLIYAGNMGRFQGLEILLDAMGRIAHRKDIELLMMGEGVAKPELVAQQNKTNANVRFFDYQPVEVAKAAIQGADIGIVALIPGMYRYAYPSKTMAYLEQGRPILAVVETESELAKTMLAESYGFSVPIGDAEALAELLVRLADDLSWKEPMNQSALVAFEKYFSAPVVLAKWSQLVGQP